MRMSLALLQNKKGMSLVELSIAVGVLSLLVMGTGVVIQSVLTSKLRSESKQEVLSAIGNFQQSFRGQSSSTTCINILGQPPGTSFNATGTSPAQITIDNKTYLDNTEVTLQNARFRIDRLYFGNTEQLASTTAYKVYSTTILLDGSIWYGTNCSQIPSRPIATVTVKVDPNGAITDCNMPVFEDAETICQSVTGMKWLQNSSACVQDVQVDSNNNFECPSDMKLAPSGVCIPSESNCYVNLLPQDFAQGIVSSCASIPAGAYLQYPTGFYPPNAPSPSPTPATNYSPTPTPVPNCSCGTQQVPPTSLGTTTIYCGVARSVGNKIGGGIDMEGDVEMTIYKCIDGNLSLLHKYYEEESDYVWSGRKPTLCYTDGRNCRPL